MCAKVSSKTRKPAQSKSTKPKIISTKHLTAKPTAKRQNQFCNCPLRNVVREDQIRGSSIPYICSGSGSACAKPGEMYYVNVNSARFLEFMREYCPYVQR